MQGLKEKTAKNILWVSLLRVVSYGISLITSLVLARLLFPDEYGIVSMAMVFIGFGEILGDFGLSAAIIQKQKENIEKELYTGATLRLIFATGLYLTVFSIAPFVADFMAEPRLTNVIRIASLQFFLTSAGFVVTVRLTRELKFNKIVLANLSGGLSKGILVIALAFLGFSYWSVVFGNLAGGLITVVVLYSFVSWKVKFVFDVKVAKELLNFGKYVLAVGIMYWATLSIGKFVVGNSFGTESLGAYEVAWTWGFVIPSVIGGVLNAVLFPTYCKVVGNKDRLRKGYLTTLKYISLFAFPVCIGLMFLAPDFVRVVLAGNTSKWDGAIPVLTIISGFAILPILWVPAGAIIVSTGNVRINFLQTLVGLLIVAIFVCPLCILFGTVGVALTYLIFGFPMFIWVISFVNKIISIHIREVLQTSIPSFLASIIGVCPILLITFFSREISFTIFILKIASFTVCYATSIYLLTRGKIIEEVKDVLALLKKKK
ncbi:MAG: lipopolysaccharide biosynthesis protein [Thermoplasmata archaeon]